MKDLNNLVYLTDYLENNNKLSIIDEIDSDFSALMPKTYLKTRVAALLIDLSAIMAINVGIHNGYALFVNEFLSPVNGRHQNLLIQGNFGFSLSIFLVLYFSYFFYTTFVMNGKTLGKLVFGLKVIKEEFVHNPKSEDYELDIKDSFRRATGYLLCYLSFGIFFIFNFASEDKRGLADYLSGSRTVSDRWLKQMQEYKQTQQEQVIIDIAELPKKQAA